MYTNVASEIHLLLIPKEEGPSETELSYHSYSLLVLVQISLNHSKVQEKLVLIRRDHQKMDEVT